MGFIIFIIIISIFTTIINVLEMANRWMDHKLKLLDKEMKEFEEPEGSFKSARIRPNRKE